MSPYTHAGGVVARREKDGSVRLLLVRSRDGRHWVLPKGHIDPGESPEQAAVREVREEAGVVGRIVGELGVDSYSLPHEEVRVLYFLMDFEQSVPADEDRELNWEDPARAASLTPFSGSRALVDEAARRLTGTR